MIKKINFNENQKNSLLYLVICGGIILIIILVGILPYYFKISNQIKENDKLKYQIGEQKELGPLYASLLIAAKEKSSLVLPHPEKTALPRPETGKFQNDLRSFAKKSGLTIVSFTPDINSSASPSTSFLHNVVLRGELSSLRKFLIELGSIPYLDRIEDISVQQNTSSMEFKLKVWIAIK
jgi:Tfp pilus assembly protein PilO